ncbi:MAG: SNF2 family helicase [Kiritimatiellae bacterium]|nr:SNF2 family helicase [Kiritimatiellia bacterium]MDW8459409.1 SNF2-related protein [Verrucomicrobiota bacterium]
MRFAVHVANRALTGGRVCVVSYVSKPVEERRQGITVGIPFTQKMLLDWAGASIFRDAQMMYERGAVQEAIFEAPLIRGVISFGNRTIHTRARVLSDGTCENLCPCRDSTERGIICAHVIAVGLALVRRHADPERERKYVEEQRRAARLAQIDESAFLKRTTTPQSGTVPARVILALASGWQRAIGEILAGQPSRIPLMCWLEIKQSRQPIDQVPRTSTYFLSKKDESILFVLEDACGGPVGSRIALSAADFINVLNLHVGKPLLEEGEDRKITVNGAPMQSLVKLALDDATGELILDLQTPLPFAENGQRPLYVLAGNAGWVYAHGHFWPLATFLPSPMRAAYLGPVRIPRESIPRFLQHECPALAKGIPLQTEITLDMFTLEPATPVFRLVVKGSPASLAACLRAEYNGISLVAGKTEAGGHFAIPDPEDIFRFYVRNLPAENAALTRAAEVGFRGPVGDKLEPLVGCRQVLNFLGRDLPALRRAGWKVDIEGPIREFAENTPHVTPVVHVREHGAPGWFEIDFEFDDGAGGSITPADVQRALLKGESFIERNGRMILLDTGAVTAMNEVFADCAAGEGTRPGSFRLPSIYASYVKSSLDALDGVDVEAAPSWMAAARRQNRELKVEPVQLPEPLEAILRPYQREGVAWLRFLELNGFAGILADEMGLGKTLQTLAWLSLPRSNPDAVGKPSLIVCPTSLVENWLEEARRFTPGLRVLPLAGSRRHEKWSELAAYDVLVTSYALLRRDIEQYLDYKFACLILDEAQHIKNRSTQNAIAAKRLRAAHRLVLTGTPIENSVSDLWSIMDFLMPGYLGSHERFVATYEQPIARGDREGEAAQARLRRKLHPFLLRRLKREVATDLPPKIEKIALCSLSPDQQTVYKELLDASRRKVFDLVMKQGFQRSRMEILKTLLRLRQVCCHLDLLNLPGLNPKMPSAKLDLFFELLDEVLDGGHRALVFSQFTSMLAILRRELDARGIRYCYLDGATQERLKEVHAFNTDRSIPLFLISLKAGGTGLNLTGADTVIHYDPWWNPAVEDQATDRAYRIGQKRTVYKLKLITKSTVEEKVLELQRRKKAVIDATLESDEQVIGALTWEDVQELLSL